MATYSTVKGFNIQTRSSDPSNPLEGEVWYNSTSNVLKAYGNTAGTWASGTALPLARSLAVTIGITTAGMVVLGGTPTSPTGYMPVPTATTEWDGSNWTTGGVVNHGEGSMQLGFGILTAAVIAGGYQALPTIPGLATSEEYDGTTWTTSNDMSEAHSDGTAAGTLTAGLVITGANAPAFVGAETEKYDGTSWTAGGNLGQGRARPQGSSCGTQTAGLCIGGEGYTTTVEQYDGASWTAAPSLNSGMYNGGASGTQTLALAYGGHPALNTTESYNGSTWSAENTLGTGRGYCNGMGTHTAAMYCGGQPGSGYVATVEEWTAGLGVITFTDI